MRTFSRAKQSAIDVKMLRQSGNVFENGLGRVNGPDCTILHTRKKGESRKVTCVVRR